jgi:hypothetical protein
MRDFLQDHANTDARDERDDDGPVVAVGGFLS